MIVNTEDFFSITEANQNFSKVSRAADNGGQVIILKNNKPKYLLVNIQENPLPCLTDDEKIEIVARRILEKHKKAFLELAK